MYLVDNITTSTKVAKIWNHNVFGHIIRKKNRILLCLEGIFRSLSFEVNPLLDHLRRDIWNDFENLLVQEEIY